MTFEPDLKEIAIIAATAQIVAAWIGKTPPDDWSQAPKMITDVRAALANETVIEIVPAKADPFIPARKSVTHDAVTCMTCGFVGKSLKRHIRTAHGQTPEQYREYWGLKADHPIVAPGYTALRSQLAKDNGLGRKS